MNENSNTDFAPFDAPHGVVIRCNGAGVFFAERVEIDRRTGWARLHSVRRIYRWRGATDVSQLAETGPTESGSQLTVVRELVVVSSVAEIQPCTERSATALRAIPVWRMS